MKLNKKFKGLQRRLCAGMLALLMALTLVPMSSVTVYADDSNPKTFSFSYAADCQRRPAYPKNGESFTASVFRNPLDENGSSGSTMIGDWKLVSKGLYTGWNGTEYYHNYGLYSVMSDASYQYGVDQTSIEVYELKDGDKHIAYGVLCGIFDGSAFYIGDTRDSGAGYVLSNKDLTTIESISETVTQDVTTGFEELPAACECTNVTKQDGQAATCTEDGWKDYYKCDNTECGKYYTSEDKTTEITDLAAWKTTEGQGRIAALGHAWGYNASGATLTATCSRTNHTATLTLSANDADYSGSEAYTGATLDGLDNFKTATGLTTDPTITYYKVDTEGATTGGTQKTAAEVIKSVGNYYAKITLEGSENGLPVSAVKAFKINKADLSASDFTYTAPSNLTYDGNAKCATVTAKSGVTGAGTITVKYYDSQGTEVASPTNAETYTVKVAVTAGDNYNAVTTPLQVGIFTINKAGSYSGTKTASADLKAKTGENVEVTLPTLPDGASYGDVTNSNTSYFTVGTVADGKVIVTSEKNWNDTSETASKTFTIKVTGATNYEDYDVTVTITPTFHNHSFTYSVPTDAPNTIVATCSADGCDLTDKKMTLTLSATSQNYSGSRDEPTITYGTTDEQAAWTNAGVILPGSTDTPTVTKKYYNADSSGQKVGPALESTPVNAGKYVVEVNITYGTDVEASVALPYEIKKAAAPAAPSGLTATAPQYIGGNNGKITGVDLTMEYSTDNGNTWKTVIGSEITGLSTGTVKVRVKETENTNAGITQEVTIPDGTEKNPAPAAPTGLTVVPASALGASDGKITGVDLLTMEYSLDNGTTWSNVPGTEITGLEAGKNVQVRFKATDTHLASIPNTLMINYHTHSWSWKFDKTSHWQECECGAKQNEADHSYVNGKCICGSKKAKPAAVHSDVKEEHSAPEAVRAAEEMFLPLNIVEQDKTGVNRDHFGIVPDKAYNLTAYVTIQGFVSAINKIEKANPKANTVSIYTGKPFTFNKRIVETIQKGGKTIIYYFYHKGHLYSVTVPATVDASKVLEKAGFAGPLYVGKMLGTTKLVK